MLGKSPKMAIFKNFRLSSNTHQPQSVFIFLGNLRILKLLRFKYKKMN